MPTKKPSLYVKVTATNLPNPRLDIQQAHKIFENLLQSLLITAGFFSQDTRKDDWPNFRDHLQLPHFHNQEHSNPYRSALAAFCYSYGIIQAAIQVDQTNDIPEAKKSKGKLPQRLAHTLLKATGHAGLSQDEAVNWLTKSIQQSLAEIEQNPLRRTLQQLCVVSEFNYREARRKYNYHLPTQITNSITHARDCFLQSKSKPTITTAVLYKYGYSSYNALPSSTLFRALNFSMNLLPILLIKLAATFLVVLNHFINGIIPEEILLLCGFIRIAQSSICYPMQLLIEPAVLSYNPDTSGISIRRITATISEITCWIMILGLTLCIIPCRRHDKKLALAKIKQQIDDGRKFVIATDGPQQNDCELPVFIMRPAEIQPVSYSADTQSADATPDSAGERGEKRKTRGTPNPNYTTTEDDPAQVTELKLPPHYYQAANDPGAVIIIDPRNISHPRIKRSTDALLKPFLRGGKKLDVAERCAEDRRRNGSPGLYHYIRTRQKRSTGNRLLATLSVLNQPLPTGQKRVYTVREVVPHF